MRRWRRGRVIMILVALVLLAAGAVPVAAQDTETVTIYLVALEDMGRSGIPVGCGDSLVPVQVEIEAGGTLEQRISRALEKLFAINEQFYGQSGLYNALWQSDLQVDDVTVTHGSAVVRLSGSLQVGGVCDEPRVEGQITQTVLQFTEVEDAIALFNGQPLFPGPAVRFFPETGHTVRAGFRAYWEQFGGLPVFGFPLTEERDEGGLRVQYFERARFEWHPGAAPARYDVLLTRLGAISGEQRGLTGTPPFQPAQPRAGCVFFPETRHNLCGGFRSYWEQFGGLAIYGYPLSEEFVDPESGLTTQYFERQRFEWHPGAWPARYDVLLGRLGAEYLASGAD